MKESPVLIPQSTTATPWPSVSVLIPVRNAEATIGATIDSVSSQDYEGSVEVIVADGSDTPATSDLVRRRYPTVTLVPNPEQIITTGIHAAHGAATGEIIVRCDAHTVFPPGYLRRAVSTLRRTGAANVGGRQRPVGTTFFGRAVAMAMTTPLGAGGARYRLGGAEGPVDTVFLGAFRRDALEAVGGVDPTLGGGRGLRTQLAGCGRAGKRCGSIPGLWSLYRLAAPCAVSLGNISITADGSGSWRDDIRLPCCPTSRQPLLLLGLAATPVLAVAGPIWAVAAVPLTYVLTLTLGSLAAGIRRRSYAALLLPLILATMHLSWGIGFLTPVRTKRELTAHPRHFRTATAALPSVSVLIPVRNAEATIGAAIDSVLSQDYKGSVEVIVADGSDTPATSDLVRRAVPDGDTGSQIRNRLPASGVAGGARGRRPEEIIVRCDAHSVFPPGYLRRAVSTLRRTGGGQCRRPATTGRHHVLRARGGDGDDHSPGGWRRPLPIGAARRGPVDTVFLGAFRRDALEAVGGVDPAFLRNQDYELNWRLRARGETVWFDPGLVVTYRPPQHLAGSCSAVLRLRPMEAGRGATTSGLPAAPASRQPAVAVGIGHHARPGRGRPHLGGSGSAAHVRPSPWRSALWRSASVAVHTPRSCSRWPPRNHAPELGNRFFTPMRTKVRVASTETVAPSTENAVPLLWRHRTGPALTCRCSRRLILPESNSQIGTQRRNPSLP